MGRRVSWERLIQGKVDGFIGHLRWFYVSVGGLKQFHGTDYNWSTTFEMPKVPSWSSLSDPMSERIPGRITNRFTFSSSLN